MRSRSRSRSHGRLMSGLDSEWRRRWGLGDATVVGVVSADVLWSAEREISTLRRYRRGRGVALSVRVSGGHEPPPAVAVRWWRVGLLLACGAPAAADAPSVGNSRNARLRGVPGCAASRRTRAFVNVGTVSVLAPTAVRRCVRQLCMSRKSAHRRTSTYLVRNARLRGSRSVGRRRGDGRRQGGLWRGRSSALGRRKGARRVAHKQLLGREQLDGDVEGVGGALAGEPHPADRQRLLLVVQARRGAEVGQHDQVVEQERKVPLLLLLLLLCARRVRVVWLACAGDAAVGPVDASRVQNKALGCCQVDWLWGSKRKREVLCVTLHGKEEEAV